MSIYKEHLHAQYEKDRAVALLLCKKHIDRLIVAIQTKYVFCSPMNASMLTLGQLVLQSGDFYVTV